MALVSFPFALFVLGLLPVYYALSRRGQNALLLAASLVFCALFDVRAVVLLVVATVADFGLGRWLAWDRPPSQRRLAMWTSVGLGVLCFMHMFAPREHSAVPATSTTTTQS